jgi:ParB-like chromosome segregation protein Spo0J
VSVHYGGETLEVHPVADLFPMLAEDELQELADDIAQRGLLQPIVLDSEGRVLDGRNRLAACELAGVEPTFETYAGDDPDGYALAVNGQRRAMNKGQKAVVGAAMLISSLDSKLKDQDVARALGVSKALLSQAITIAGYKDLAALVLANTRPFSTALEEAQKRDVQAAEENAAKDRLRTGAPDLLALVDEERLTLAVAIAELESREERARIEEEERLALEREAQVRSDRLATLPPDLAARVESGDLQFPEAETVVKQRGERLGAWAEKIRAGLETLTRMVGNPIPAELKEHLSDDEITTLVVIIGALENGERQ